MSPPPNLHPNPAFPLVPLVTRGKWSTYIGHKKMAAAAYGHGALSILHYRIKDGKVPFLGPPGMMKLKRKRKHTLLIGGAVQGISLLVAAGATALTAAMAAMAVNKQAAVQAIRRGMQRFIESKVEESLVEFDKALELDPSQKPYLWQRGLSLYYLNRFEEAAAQFRDDIAVNPNDTEEAIWCFLAEAQLYGVGKARQRFVEVGTDSRLVMRKTHELFKTGGNPENDLLSDFAVDNGHDYFYAVLYAGLYYESQKNEMASKEFIMSAANSSYALRSNDYMAFLAKVHCVCRGW